MNISFRRRGKCGMIYCRIKGGKLPKPEDFSTKSTVLREAHKVGYERLAQLEAAEKAGDLVDRPALTAEILCKLDQSRARTEATHMDYATNRIAYYWDAIGSFYKDFYNVTSASISDYVNFRVGPDPLHPRYKHQTIQRELHALVRGLKIAADAGHKVNVPHRIPKLKAHDADPKRRAHNFSPDQMFTFISELMRIDGRGSSAPMALAIFTLGTGWRAGEFEHLHKVRFYTSDLCKAGDWVMMDWPENVRKSKQPGSMAVPALVAQLVTHLPPAGSNYRRAWQAAAKRAGLTKVPTLRCLRHTFANAADRSGDPYGVDLAMDHARQVKGRYRHTYEERMAKILVATMQGYAPIFGWPEGLKVTIGGQVRK